jgi:hypothetical protein
MVASRSYMCIEPIELWLDTDALRRGLVIPQEPDPGNPHLLMVQDSGMVPVSTQIAIVNPETNHLSLVGEFGEIWVQSEANAHGFYGSTDPFDSERFNGRTVDGDPQVRYVRTGDLGFLHNVSRPIGPGGQQVEMQVLFVLGSIGETFEVNGLSHFPMDIERSVEGCHRSVAPFGCAVFQAGGLVVVLVEVVRKNFLASVVPTIVNTVLNEHHLVVDIVAFVSQGEFPRSRLAEKQRGKILASWVTRKLHTIAQFSIREQDSPLLADIVPSGAGPQDIASATTAVASGNPGVGSMLSRVESGLSANTANLQMQRDLAAKQQAIQENFAAQEAQAQHEANVQHHVETARAAELPGTLQIGPTSASGPTSLGAFDQTASPISPSAAERTPTNPLHSHVEYPGMDTPTGPPGVLTTSPTSAPSLGVVNDERGSLDEPGVRYGTKPHLDSNDAPIAGGPAVPGPRYESDEEEWPQEAIMHMNLNAH